MDKKIIAYILCSLILASAAPAFVADAQNCKDCDSASISAGLMGSLKEKADLLRNQVQSLINRLGKAEKGIKGEISDIATDKSSLTLTIGANGGAPITVKIGTATKITLMNGEAATASDLEVGQNIGVKGALANNIIEATNIIINDKKPPVAEGEKRVKGIKHIAGVIIAVDGATSDITTITLQKKGLTQGTIKVNVNAATIIKKHGETATKADLVNGVAVMAVGPLNASGEIDATRIGIAGTFNLAITGTVSAASGTSLTITVNNGKNTGDYIVTPAANAKIIKNDVNATLADIEVGDIVKARGVIDIDSSEKTMSAMQIIVLGGAEEFDSAD